MDEDDDKELDLIPEEADENEEAESPKDSNGNKALDKVQNAKDKIEKAKDVKDKVEKGKKAVDTAKKVGKLSKTLGPLAPVLGYIAVIIAILIAAIGLLMFLLTMPGAIIEFLKDLARDFGNKLIDIVIGHEENVKISQIASIGTKLEDMGYDLYSYGFLSDPVSVHHYYDSSYDEEKAKNDKKHAWEHSIYYTKYLENEVPTSDFFDKDYNPDYDSLYVSEDGVLRDKNGVLYIDSDYIRAYLVSDNYVYMLKNNEFSLKTVWEKITSFKFFETLFHGNFGKGLIELYHEKDDFRIGDAYGVFKAVEGFLENLTGQQTVSISVDRDAKQLVVSTAMNGYYGIKRKFSYSLDGWTGRYGMPVEFLLSLHLASMQPDLAYDLVRETKTLVRLTTHETDAKIEAGVKGSDGKIYTNIIDIRDMGYEELNKLAEKYGLHDVRQSIIHYTMGEAYKEAYDDAYGFITDFETYPKKEDDEQRYNFYQAVDEIVDRIDNYVDLLEKVDIAEFKTQIPYIYDVQGHWFRDVYFTNNDEHKFITTDDEYEKRTGERWTKYETVPVGSTGTDTSDLANTITYGTGDSQYVAERSEYTKGGLGDVQYVLYYYPGGDVSKEPIKYMLPDGTYGTKDDADTDTRLSQEEKESLHKKAVMFQLIPLEAYQEDFEWYEEGLIDAIFGTGDAKEKRNKSAKEQIEELKRLYGDSARLFLRYDQEIPVDFNGLISGESYRWVAYRYVSGQTTGWQQYEDDDGTYDNVFYKITMDEGIEQVEDGQRGPTNRLTKEIFSQRKYYTYNGTAERAKQIDMDRYDIVYDKDGNEVDLRNANREDISAEDYEKPRVREEYLNYKKGDSSTINTANDPRNKDLIEKFSVSRDSMSAFNILTNMNTLDSEAIYHDFKELIVELDYFDKEELTAVPNESFEWPIPEIGSRGWPIRKYSKYETEYGTALHSEYLLNFMKQKELIGATLEDPDEQEEVNDRNIELEDNEVKESSIPIAKYNGINDILSEQSKVQAQDTKLGAPNGELGYTGNNDIIQVGSGPSKSPSEVTVGEYLEATEAMCVKMDQDGYDYCVKSRAENCTEDKGGKGHCSDKCRQESEDGKCIKSPDCDCGQVHCNHSVHHNNCVLPTSFEMSQSDIKYHNVCCATLVSWSLQNVGLMSTDECYNVVSGVANYCINVLEGERINKGETLQPGDILVYENNSHIDILGDEYNGDHLKYNGGQYVKEGAEATKDHSSIQIQKGDGWKGKVTDVAYAIRLNWGGSLSTDAYKGYKGGELVVSPVTGMVIQAGVANVITNIETGLKEYVGFMKIRVLDRTDFTAAFGKNGSDEDDLKGYKYFLEEYEDNKVAGDIMYIEGFHMELVREDETKTDEMGHKKYILNVGDEAYETNMKNGAFEIINEYTKKDYSYVVNKRTREKLEDKEDAKKDARACYIDVNGNFFIKEGTAIGTTYSDGDYEVDYQKYLNELRSEAGESEWAVKGKSVVEAPRSGRKIYVRPGLEGTNGSKNLTQDYPDVLKNNGDGNYIRMILRASKDGTDAQTDKDSLIENVEDYIEIAPKPQQQIDWELFFWLPHESGPADMNGPICYEYHGGGRVVEDAGDEATESDGSARKACATVGLIQWMTSSEQGGTNNIAKLCRELKTYDTTVGNAVSYIGSWTNEQIIEDVQGDRKIEETFKSINAEGTMHDRLMWAELEVAKAQYYNSLIINHPWIAKLPKCVQGAILHIGVHDGHYPDDLDDWENLGDNALILNKVSEHWKGSWKNTEPAIAKAILQKKLTTEDVEFWVRNKDVSTLVNHGVEYNNYNKNWTDN